QGAERLRSARTESYAPAGGRDDGRGTACRTVGCGLLRRRGERIVRHRFLSGLCARPTWVWPGRTPRLRSGGMTGRDDSTSPFRDSGGAGAPGPVCRVRDVSDDTSRDDTAQAGHAGEQYARIAGRRRAGGRTERLFRVRTCRSARRHHLRHRAPRHFTVLCVSSAERAGLRLGSGGEYLVEQGLGLVLVGVLRERELADQNLARLGEHALLTGGETALALTTPQVTHDFRDLDDIARGELLQVCLVATGPVRGLLGIRCAQHLEDSVQPVLTDHIAHADELRIVRWHTYRQITLGDLQHQVGLVHAFDLASFDSLDQRGPVMGIDHGVANLERHVTGTPSVAIQGNTDTAGSE